MVTEPLVVAGMVMMDLLVVADSAAVVGCLVATRSIDAEAGSLATWVVALVVKIHAEFRWMVCRIQAEYHES